MLRRLLSPAGRVYSPRWALVTALALWLAASACTLNPAPDGGQAVVAGPPQVRLVAPLPNATFLEGVAVNIQAFVSNAGADIDRVEVTVDNEIVQTLPQPNPQGGPGFSVTHSWQTTGVGSHTVGVTAFRAGGEASEPATATINVISTAEDETEEPIPTLTLPPTSDGDDADSTEEGGDAESAEGTEDADSTEEGGDVSEADARATRRADRDGEGGDEGGDGPPEVTFTQGVNVRRGPGTNFVPPIGSFAADQTAELLGVNPAGDWYKVQYYNAEGWVFAQLTTVSGDTSNLPVDPGPPTPVPATATPIPPTAPPATAVPQSQANLVAGIIRTDPDNPRCNQTFTVQVDIANLGTSDTTVTGTFTVRDSAGGNTTETSGPIPIIEAGETVASAEIPITVATNFNEEHTLEVILNPSGSIPETNSGDNRGEKKYELRQGDC